MKVPTTDRSGFWALTVDGATAEENNVLNYGNAVSNDIGDGDLNIGQVGRSDHQYFHDAGIDAAVFSWMYWAGGTNIVLEPAYHMTTDTLEFVSAERMGYAAQVLGSSAFLASLNEVSVQVVDENDAPAADVDVSMSCGDDDGWREVGATDQSGAVSTAAPHTTCDFVALADSGAEGSTLETPISGNATVEINLQVDTQAPVVEVHVDPAATATGWHTTSPAQVAVTATDNHDPDPYIELSRDGVSWTPYTGPIDVDSDGTFEFHARATDEFGNVGYASDGILIDTERPQLSAAMDETDEGLIHLEATDAVSGVDRIEYRTGSDEQWQDLNTEVDEVGAVIAHVHLSHGSAAEFRAHDIAGNASDLVSVDVEGAGAGGDEPAAGSGSGEGSLVTTGLAPMWLSIVAAILLVTAGGAALTVRRKANVI